MNKNAIIIILLCIIVILSAVILISVFSNQAQSNQTAEILNNTSYNLSANDSLQVEEIADNSENSADNAVTHREHLNGGDVEVDSNGMVVVSYNSKGEYFPEGQMSGMSIDEAREMDEYWSVHGME